MTFRLTLHLPDDDRQLEISADRSQRMLTELLTAEGFHLNTRCGHRALCDGCLVELLAGTLQTGESAQPVMADYGPKILRACELQVPVDGQAEIAVPVRSLLAHQPQVVSSFSVNVPRAHDPLWQEIVLEHDDLPAEQPLMDALAQATATRQNWSCPVRATNRLAKIEPDREGRFHLVCQRAQDHWSLDAGPRTMPAFGAAVDVGTTTVAVAMVDLSDGRIAGIASALNAQVALGDNVLTRINGCMVKPHLTARMQRVLIRKTLGPLLHQAAVEAGIEPHQLVAMVVAGNSTMLHLLAGIDPSSMGTAPFTATFLEHRVLDAGDLQLRIGPLAAAGTADLPAEQAEPSPAGLAAKFPVHLLPGAAAYVGADITAGILASGMAYRQETSLLVDLGTNGEIVLRQGQRLLGCATAAGPAFEGAGLTYGVRAGRGAIGHLWLDPATGDPRVEVIGGGVPIGVCGTAYVDFVARARQNGLLNAAGRFCESAAPRLMRHEKHGLTFPVGQGRDGQSILITEADVASLLQAKAAIGAGVHCLLKQAGLVSQDIQTVYLAGGFGFHMHVDSLLGCGLLPGFVPQQVTLVGNTALAGAFLALMDSGALDEINRLCQQIEIVELNQDPEFETTYIDHLSLPTATVG